MNQCLLGMHPKLGTKPLQFFTSINPHSLLCKACFIEMRIVFSHFIQSEQQLLMDNQYPQEHHGYFANLSLGFLLMPQIDNLSNSFFSVISHYLTPWTVNLQRVIFGIFFYFSKAFPLASYVHRSTECLRQEWAQEVILSGLTHQAAPRTTSSIALDHTPMAFECLHG